MCVAIALNYCFCCMNNTFPSILYIMYTYVVPTGEDLNLRILYRCIVSCRSVQHYAIRLDVYIRKVYLDGGES